jgi:hypothetical protein
MMGERCYDAGDEGATAGIKKKRVKEFIFLYPFSIIGLQSLDLGVANGFVLEGFVDSLVIFVIEFPIERVDDPVDMEKVAGRILLVILLCNGKIFLAHDNLVELACEGPGQAFFQLDEVFSILFRVFRDIHFFGFTGMGIIFPCD